MNLFTVGQLFEIFVSRLSTREAQILGMSDRPTRALASIHR